MTNFSIYYSDLTYEKQQDILEALINEERKKLYEEAQEAIAKYQKYKGWSNDEVLNDLYFDLDWTDWATKEEYKKSLIYEIDSLAEKNAEKRIGSEFRHYEVEL